MELVVNLSRMFGRTLSGLQICLSRSNQIWNGEINSKFAQIDASLRKFENVLEEMKTNDKFAQIDGSLRTFQHVQEKIEIKINAILDNQNSRKFNDSVVKTATCAPALGELIGAMKVLELNLEKLREEVDAKLNKILTSVEVFDQRRCSVDEITTQEEASTRITAPRAAHRGDARLPRNCADIQKIQGEERNGSYTIYPTPSFAVSVSCDLSTNGGGGTVFQVRGADVPEGQRRTNFYRNWVYYENGFGSVQQDYWLGLRILAALCALGDCELRVKLMDWSGDRRYANYRNFTITGPQDGYRAAFAGYFGDAGDVLSYHSGMKFSTSDVDNDISTRNGAQACKGGGGLVVQLLPPLELEWSLSWSGDRR